MSNFLNKHKAIIFDFDGLIIDSEWVAFQAWQTIFTRHKAKLNLEDWIHCVGSSYGLFDPCAELEKQTGQNFDRQVLVDEKNKTKAEICESLPLMPGLQKFFSHLENTNSHTLAVASSSFQDWVHPHLKRLGINHKMQTIVTGDMVKALKPAPDLYLLAAKNIGIEARDCLVFEDSENGIKAAKAAGMSCIAIPNRITAISNFSSADQVLSSFEEIFHSLVD